MISVQNHRLPLSGSNYLVIVFLGLIFFSSCKPKIITTQNPIPPVEVVIDTVPAVLDTMVVVEIDLDTVDSDEIIMEPDIYKIGLALPFFTNDFITTNHVSDKSNWAMNFYSGVLLAKEEISVSKQFEIEVADSKKLYSNFDFEDRFSDVNLLIGPASKNILPLAIDFCKQKDIPLFSPFVTSSKNVDYEKYIQFKPSLKTHCNRILEHARKGATKDDIYLILNTNPKERAAAKYFQEGIKEMTLDKEAKLNVITIEKDKWGTTQTAEIDSLFNDGLSKTFIIVAWKDQSFIFDALNAIGKARKMTNVSVYGFPQWLNWVSDNYGIYEGLDVKLSSYFFTDIGDVNVDNFRRRYFNKFGDFPTMEAYEGYSIFWMAIKSLDEFGLNFIPDINNVSSSPFWKFEFDKVLYDFVDDLHPEKYKYIENKHVDLLIFRDNYIKILSE